MSVPNIPGLNSEEDVKKFLLSSVHWVTFAETYFKNPEDETLPLVLDPNQVKTINAIQFGYDIDEVPKKPSRIPKGVVMIWPRGYGKSIAVVVASAVLLITTPNVRIGVMAQKESFSQRLLERICEFIEKSPFRDMIRGKPIKSEVRMIHGARCVAHSTSEGIRGRHYHYLILDEAAIIEDRVIIPAILTTRRVGIRWMMLSTPAGARGELITRYIKGLRTRPVVCNNCGQEYKQEYFIESEFHATKMPALVNCVECGSNDYFYGVGLYSVITVDPYSSSFFSPERVKRELMEAGNTPMARQELLGEILPEGQMIFQKEWIEKCVNRKLRNVMKADDDEYYCMGLDFGKIHDCSVFIITHRDLKTNHIIIDYVKYIDPKYEVIEYKDIRHDVIKMVSYFQPSWLVPDSTGIGDPIMEDIVDDLENIRTTTQVYSNKKNRIGFVFDTRTKPDLIENLVGLFAKGMIEIPPSAEPIIDRLVEELLFFSYKITQNDYIRYGVQTHGDDGVIALALSCWGHKERPWITPQFKHVMPRGEYGNVR